MASEMWDEDQDLIVRLAGKLSRCNKKLEAVKDFILSRRDDIEKDLENFGMLQPVLTYFLKEAEA